MQVHISPYVVIIINHSHITSISKAEKSTVKHLDKEYLHRTQKIKK